ncbi:phosphoglycolate phosphatase [Henriciella sp. AS95]|uniref:phosphoglycolate phosphatase n=1 Tax=Henriciella sp. AS95 TaxID=3135782 RepID=UPI003176C689
METHELDGWTIIFDLDGTLVDSAPDLHAALNDCLTRSGYDPVAFDLIHGMIGEGAKAMIRKALTHQGEQVSETVVDDLWGDFLNHYRENLCHLSSLYPGVETALDEIAAAGATLAVCTNKPQALSEAVLSGFGIFERFAAIVGADAVPDKKPNGDHVLEALRRAGGDQRRSMMIGDSQIDERAARNAGLPFVFAPFGYGPEPVDLSKVSGVYETYGDLPGLIRAIRF